MRSDCLQRRWSPLWTWRLAIKPPFDLELSKSRPSPGRRRGGADQEVAMPEAMLDFGGLAEGPLCHRSGARSNPLFRGRD